MFELIKMMNKGKGVINEKFIVIGISSKKNILPRIDLWITQIEKVHLSDEKRTLNVFRREMFVCQQILKKSIRGRLISY